MQVRWLSSALADLPDVIETFSESDIPIIVQLIDWASIHAEFQREITASHVVVHSALQTEHVSQYDSQSLD